MLCSRRIRYHSLLFRLQTFLSLFLVADTQLYKRLCPSVRRSIGPWVGPSRVSEFKPKSDLTSINAPAQRSRLIWLCIGLELITENRPNPLGLAEYVPMLKKRLYLKGKCSGTSLSCSPPQGSKQDFSKNDCKNSFSLQMLKLKAHHRFVLQD